MADGTFTTGWNMEAAWLTIVLVDRSTSTGLPSTVRDSRTLWNACIPKSVPQPFSARKRSDTSHLDGWNFIGGKNTIGRLE